MTENAVYQVLQQSMINIQAEAEMLHATALVLCEWDEGARALDVMLRAAQAVQEARLALAAVVRERGTRAPVQLPDGPQS